MPSPPPSREIVESDYHLPVHSIRVVVHTTGIFFDSDTRSGNHASIFLTTGDGKSVRLNMVKGGPTDTMGTYREQRCEYDVSNSSLRVFDLQASEGLTVGHVLQFVRAKGRHIYKLASNGLGCRFWV